MPYVPGRTHTVRAYYTHEQCTRRNSQAFALLPSSGRLPPRGRGLRKVAAASTGASALGVPQVARGRREQAAGRRQAARGHGTGVGAALVAKAVSFSIRALSTVIEPFLYPRLPHRL